MRHDFDAWMMQGAINIRCHAHVPGGNWWQVARAAFIVCNRKRQDIKNVTYKQCGIKKQTVWCMILH